MRLQVWVVYNNVVLKSFQGDNYRAKKFDITVSYYKMWVKRIRIGYQYVTLSHKESEIKTYICDCYLDTHMHL